MSGSDSDDDYLGCKRGGCGVDGVNGCNGRCGGGGGVVGSSRH